MNEIYNLLEIILLLVAIYLLFNLRRQNNGTQVRYGGKKLAMDTSALIDGRILDIVQTGFAPSQLIIPRFIIDELQLLADGHDSQKRERARFGLDIVQALQASDQCEIIMADDQVDPKLPTDSKLVVVAKKRGADLCTTDYNLNKVATIDGVRVLNVNELANAVRPTALPGERKRIKIVQKGSSKNQGVGYLEDGSMVVVEGASNAIGKMVDVEVSRYIQTDAGKMLFGNKVGVQSRQSTKTRPDKK